MNEPKLRPTSLDYALAAISPALIILMIGSLVAFLMTALYRGEFPVRLMWVLGLFTFASVLISRIAIEQSRCVGSVFRTAGLACLWIGAIDHRIQYRPEPRLVLYDRLSPFRAPVASYDFTPQRPPVLAATRIGNGNGVVDEMAGGRRSCRRRSDDGHGDSPPPIARWRILGAPLQNHQSRRLASTSLGMGKRNGRRWQRRRLRRAVAIQNVA